VSGVSHRIDRYAVVFDDESLVADGGLLAAATLMGRLGLEALVDEVVQLGGRAGGANPGRKVLTLVASMLAGGSHIDHVGRLRAGSTERVLGFEVMAPSTVGTFLRSFTWGHALQLDKACTEALGRVWAAGAGPGDDALTLDVDSTICEVSGKAKAGAAFGYTNVLGYHPLVATRADTGEIVGARLRGGASQGGVVHFAKETIGRVRRAGASGDITVRADSGFWSYEMFKTLEGLGVGWSITTPQYNNVRQAITGIDKDAWTSINYPQDGVAQVAETTIWATHRTRRRERMKLRLIVRRTRLTGPQRQLWPDWRYHTFVTSLERPAAEADQHHHTDSDQSETEVVEADRYHRAHAVCELAIRDLKSSAGLSHLPSGSFAANAAWLACAALAHNIYRWIGLLGRTEPREQLVYGSTIRARLFGIPARLLNHSGQHILRLPARWPWANTYLTTLGNLRSLPQLC
jgi:hypothetical protein